MNPWKIIGWIVLGFLVLVMFSCYRAFAPRSSEEQARYQAAAQRAEAQRPTPPTYSLSITGFSCDESTGGGYTKMTVMVKNTGPRIGSAKLFATIGGQPEDTYFNPYDIPAGSVSTATLMSRTRGDCRVVAVQDRAGNPVKLETALPD